MVECNQLILNIHAGSHLFGAAHQDTDFPLPYLFKQLFPLGVCFGVMDERNLLRFHALCNQRRLHRFIEIKAAVIFRSALVTEDKLCQPLLCCLMVNLRHIPGADIELGIRVIRQGEV